MNEFNISCVRIATQHLFENNLILEQYKLRHRVLVEQLNWSDIYVENGMEFDRYDNPATEYIIATNRAGDVVGCIRTHPTTIPYMLSEVFPYLIEGKPPVSVEVQELSRLVCDGNILTKKDKSIVTQLLFLGAIQRGLQRNIKYYVGFVDSTVGQEVFVRDKWQMKRGGGLIKLESGEVVHSVVLPVSEATKREMESSLAAKNNGKTQMSLSFGKGSSDYFLANAAYSPATLSKKKWLHRRVWFKFKVLLLALNYKVKWMQRRCLALIEG